MSTTDELLDNAQTYHSSFDKGDLPLPPGRKIAILACMDARLNPYGLLGLQEGDAAGAATDGGAKVLARGPTGAAHQLEGATPSRQQLDDSAKAIDTINRAKGKEYVESQPQPPRLDRDPVTLR